MIGSSGYHERCRLFNLAAATPVTIASADPTRVALILSFDPNLASNVQLEFMVLGQVPFTWFRTSNFPPQWRWKDDGLLVQAELRAESILGAAIVWVYELLYKG